MEEFPKKKSKKEREEEAAMRRERKQRDRERKKQEEHEVGESRAVQPLAAFVSQCGARTVEFPPTTVRFQRNPAVVLSKLPSSNRVPAARLICGTASCMYS